MQAQNDTRCYFFVHVKKGQQKRTDEKLLQLVVERMKELRLACGYSQEYVIEHTKLNLSQYEAKIHLPSLDSLSILCKFYGISIGEFFAPMNYPPKEE